MEKNTMDEGLKEMLRHSRQELTNPEFDKSVMHKIMLESERSLKRRLWINAISLVAAIELVILLALLTLNPSMSDFTYRISVLPGQFLVATGKVFTWIIQNEFIIVPLTVMTLLKKIIDSRLKYS